MERYTYEITFTRLDGQPDETQQYTDCPATTGRPARMRFWRPWNSERGE